MFKIFTSIAAIILLTAASAGASKQRVVDARIENALRAAEADAVACRQTGDRCRDIRFVPMMHGPLPLEPRR